MSDEPAPKVLKTEDLDNGTDDGKDEKLDKPFGFSNELSLEQVRKWQDDFCVERNWGQYHTPRNILLALVGEVGELSEIFQWKGEVKEGLPEFTDEEKTHVGEELSDVLIYLVRLAEKCKIDLPTAVARKFEMNRKKYPAKKVYGKSNKYTDYQT